MLLHLCQWLQHTAAGTGIRESAWVFPIIETLHVLGLSLSVGLLFVSDLRLVGVAMRQWRASTVWHNLTPWMTAGFLLMFSTGALLFWSQPINAYNSVFFRTKLALIGLAAVNAAIYHLTIFRRMHEWDADAVPPPYARLSGWLSLLIWTGVIAAGRAMAYTL